MIPADVTIDSMLREAEGKLRTVEKLRTRTAKLTPNRWLEDQHTTAYEAVRRLRAQASAARMAQAGWQQ